jgi:hypothetical protein
VAPSVREIGAAVGLNSTGSGKDVDVALCDVSQLVHLARRAAWEHLGHSQAWLRRSSPRTVVCGSPERFTITDVRNVGEK